MSEAIRRTKGLRVFSRGEGLLFIDDEGAPRVITIA